MRSHPLHQAPALQEHYITGVHPLCLTTTLAPQECPAETGQALVFHQLCLVLDLPTGLYPLYQALTLTLHKHPTRLYPLGLGLLKQHQILQFTNMRPPTHPYWQCG